MKVIDTVYVDSLIYMYKEYNVFTIAPKINRLVPEQEVMGWEGGGQRVLKV